MNFWRWRLALSIAAAGLAIAAPAFAQEAPRLPKPRPAAVAAETQEAAPAPVATATTPSDAERKAVAAATVTAAAPRPRPPADPDDAVALWAEEAEARFRNAAAIGEDIAPVTLPVAFPSMPAAEALAAIDAFARLPRPRPEESSPLLAMVVPDDGLIEPAEPPEPPPMPRPPTQTAAEYSACLVRLKALGVEFTEEPAIDPTGSCNVDRPLNVTAVGAGVALAPDAILNCVTAEALALWTAKVVLPAARRHLGAAPEKINHASTYVCRPRNNVVGEKLSEHAYANAVDIASIEFADRPAIDVRTRSEGDGEAAFQREVRVGSCTYFTTVLGPGSNAAHATHFHFDMAERRGGYRLCDLGAAVAGAP